MKARTCPHGKLLSQSCSACEKMDKIEQHNTELIRLQGDTIKAQQVEIAKLKGLLQRWLNIGDIEVGVYPIIEQLIADTEAQLGTLGNQD